MEDIAKEESYVQAKKLLLMIDLLGELQQPVTPSQFHVEFCKMSRKKCYNKIYKAYADHLRLEDIAKDNQWFTTWYAKPEIDSVRKWTDNLVLLEIKDDEHHQALVDRIDHRYIEEVNKKASDDMPPTLQQTTFQRPLEIVHNANNERLQHYDHNDDLMFTRNKDINIREEKEEARKDGQEEGGKHLQMDKNAEKQKNKVYQSIARQDDGPAGPAPKLPSTPAPELPESKEKPSIQTKPCGSDLPISEDSSTKQSNVSLHPKLSYPGYMENNETESIKISEGADISPSIPCDTNNLESSIDNTSIDDTTHDYSQLNIILMGETGIGKSTFINSIANYIQYKTLKEAEKKGLTVLVPSQFTLTDTDYVQKVINVSPTTGNVENCDNERMESATSRTQKSLKHSINWKDKIINIIDTPGIGDTRGIIQDENNMKNIIKALSEEDHINAICILLRPNDAMITAEFAYCMGELIQFLPSSAYPNLFFCFTHSRQTFFKPGDSLVTLRTYFQTQNVDLPTDETNLFAFDNEGFRALCAIQNGIKYNSTELKEFATSWENSYKQSCGLLDQISQRKPYKSPKWSSKVEEKGKINKPPVTQNVMTSSIDSVQYDNIGSKANDSITRKHTSLPANLKEGDDEEKELMTGLALVAAIAYQNIQDLCESAKKLKIDPFQIVPNDKSGEIRVSLLKRKENSDDDQTKNLHCLDQFEKIDVVRSNDKDSPILHELSYQRGVFQKVLAIGSTSKHKLMTPEYLKKVYEKTTNKSMPDSELSKLGSLIKYYKNEKPAQRKENILEEIRQCEKIPEISVLLSDNSLRL